jgi:tryptophan synthase alpha chain
MNRIDEKFSHLRSNGAAALIPFLMAGDPDVATTGELVRAAAENGADLIEIGVPFSDPTADGPVIQKSAEVALRAGASLPRVLELVADLRRSCAIPIILYGYYNPLFRYGTERFADDARRAGVDGVLVVDLPPEESRELLPSLRHAGLHFISLLAPTTGDARMRKIARNASGFVYYVSVTGVTGGRPMQSDSVRPAVERLRSMTDLPIGVGFGISTPEQAGDIARFADAAVVGTAIMRVVQEQRGSAGIVGDVAAFIRRLKEGMRAAGS